MPKKPKQDRFFVDPVRFGRLVTAARIGAGFEGKKDFCISLTEITGYRVTQTTIGNIENGMQLPSLELMLAMQRVLPTMAQFEYLAPAIWFDGEFGKYKVAE